MRMQRRHREGKVPMGLVGIAALAALCGGCFYSPLCPPASPANDSANWPVAERGDFPGVWQISFTGNLAIDGMSGWRFGPGDHFLSFDEDGDPKYEGVMAPGNETALWRWDLRSGVGAPSQAAAGVPNREDAAATVDADAEGTAVVEISYREPFQRRTDLADTDVVVRYEQLRISQDGNTLTGLRRETRSFVNPFVPLPDVEEVAWRVSLRRVEANVIAEQPGIALLADVTAQGGAVPPWAVGQVFDLTGALDTSNGTSGTPSQWVWVIYRTVKDAGGAIVNREHVAELSGQATSFAADRVGIYTVQLWATDGAQWSSAPAQDVVVE
jgi:hypothetical protein